MKRFALFAGYTRYPHGGWSDFVGSFDDKLQAEAHLEALQRVNGRLDWYHVVDFDDRDVGVTTDFGTHPWNDVEARVLVCPLCGVDATDQPRDQVRPCITRIVNTGTARYDVYIGRGRGEQGKWGSPFIEGRDGTRDEVIAKYRTWLLTQPKLLADLPQLRGRVLGCWCRPKACHGDVLAELADQYRDLKPDNVPAMSPATPAHEDIVGTQLGEAVADLAGANGAEVLIYGVAITLPRADPTPQPDLPIMHDDDLDLTTIILDVESTGVDTSKDRIVELAIQFGFDGEQPAPQRVWTFNPEQPIPEGASKVHGILDVHVASAPIFRHLAQRVYDFIDAADVIIGYNIKFDLAILTAELERVGMRLPDLTNKAIVDTLRLWHQFEPRTLVAAHAKFVGESFEGAHSAANDIAATARVALGMLDAFALRDCTWAEIAEKADPDRKRWLGPTNHFQWEGDVVVVTFGKCRGAKLHELESNGLKGYLTWMKRADFPSHVKAIGTEALKRGGGQAFLDWATAKYPPPIIDVPIDEVA